LGGKKENKTAKKAIEFLLRKEEGLRANRKI
jgi:hypothetical protein